MFKRITTFLTVLFMGLVLTVRSPVKADTFSIPFSAIPDLLNAFYTVASGGKIEFSALIGSATGIDDFLENLHDYYNEHYTQPLLQSTQGLIDIGLSALALDGIDSIDSINNISIPINPQDIANFMGYDINWTDRYDISDSISVNPDPNYIAYLNRINLRDASDPTAFWFYNVPKYSEANSNVYLVTYPTSDYSWIAYDSTFNYLNNYSTPYCIASDIISIHIYNNNGTYSYSVSGTGVSSTVRINNSNDVWNLASFRLNNGYGSTFNLGGNGNSTAYTFSRTYSNSDLANVFFDISQHFKNVNIYVDDELWSWVGDVAVPGITLDNSIPIGNTGNITYGVYPFTATGDIGLDLAKWGEYIFNKFLSGVDSLSMDTVIDDGWDLVDTEDGERAITQDDEEDVAKVIHGFVDTTATTPTPTPDIGDPPVLKIIPPILELPDEIWPDGGRDTTVLAQMVHATDVAIPNDIMTVIWSTIGLLVVGGLISILHK